MICKLCVQKEGREAGEEGGKVSFKKKKMTLEQAFFFEKATPKNVPLDTKQTVDFNSIRNRWFE